MKPRNTFASNRLVVLGIKYIPFISTLLLTVHVALLLLGVYEPVTVAVAGILLVLLVYLLSIRFGFCRLHRAMIIYMIAMALCITCQKYGVFGITLSIFRLAMFTFGIILLVLSLIKMHRDDGKC